MLIVALASCDGPRPPADGGDFDGGPDASVEDAATPEDATTPPDADTPECGDGVVEGDEECDDGEDNSDTTPDACRTDCTMARCGDAVIDTGETCDGAELGGRTCVDEGFESGTLLCAADCGSFDTSSCSEEPGPTCGDGVREGTEACDGSDLGTASCASEGFDGGTLACTGTCELDTSGCFSCGDGVVNGTEQCDGSDLGTASCASEGFDGGTLSCSASCTFDTSGCFSCGDGVVNGTEQCDGSDLGTASCTSEGFDGGTLSCSASCTFDTSACFGCGDGARNGTEACDGTDLGGATCASEGFDGGTLACSPTCELVTTGCFACGDGTRNGTEECDGSDLGGATCASEGYDGGTLSCTAGCAFDVSACFRCGDGVRNPGEDCDGPDLGGASCTDLGFDGGELACSSSCTFATAMCTDCGNGTAEGAEECDGSDLRGATCASRPGFASGPLACSASCTYDESACSAAATPSAHGEIVISEIMQNPAAFPDEDGEWFEVHNPGTAPLNLFGCEVRGTGGAGDRFTIDANVVVPPGGYATFAEDTTEPGAPGFTPDYQWTTGFALGNAADAIIIECGGTVIDAVMYDDGASFPDPNGRSMTLDPASLDATANDAGVSWCEATSTYASGDRGTPGAPNDPCPQPIAIDFCRLQFPVDLTAGVDVGSSVTVYGRYFSAGVTDDASGTTVTPPPAFLRVQLGYGPDGSDPATDTGWVWTSAVPNTSYGPGTPGHEPNHDEYQAELVAPAAGSYDFAYRFSGDRGVTWVYCDAGAGSSNGYSPDDAGQLVTVAPTVTANLYFSEYIEGSSNNKAVEIYNAGTADVDLGACTVAIYFNGSSSPSNIPLTGTLAPGEVHTVCHSSINTGLPTWPTGYACNETSGSLTFNGDDAVAIVCSGVTLDVLGQIGVDPGNAWTGGGLSTVDRTLRRMCTVTTGDADGSDPFDPSVEWDGFAQDDVSGLGSRGCP